MIQIKPIESKDCKNIVDWNSNKDEDYLYQWAGPKTYSYPITLEQITNRLNEENTIIFKILHESEMIGSIELCRIDKENGLARVCRFIIKDDAGGKGFGQKALQAVVDFAFNELHLSRLELGVFAYNVQAIRCYEKSGFLVEKYHESNDPRWNSYTMAIDRKNKG